MRLKALLFIASMAVITGCDNSEHDGIKKSVTDFGNAFFNYDMKRAMDLCTPESRKHISYLSSIVNEKDLAVLNSSTEAAEIDINDIEVSDGDTVCTASIDVCNWLYLDAIDENGQFANKENLILRLVKRNNKWLVDFRMEDLRQSETSDHD